MQVQSTPSGLIVPVEAVKPKPKKERLPLEFSDSEDRKKVSDIFSTLRNMHGVRGGILNFDGIKVAEGRDIAIMALAKQLLGEDWDCEILC